MRFFALAPLFLFTGCPEGGTDTVNLTFGARVNGETAACGVEYNVGTGDELSELADARMFISNIEVRNEEGMWIPITLVNNDWQTETVGLLDFEDGTGECADSGTAETNRVLAGTVESGDYDAVRYEVGVPFELNHIDSATAPAPLNSPGMFWTWQGGYKHIRVDWAVDGAFPSRWNGHLGSTGCVSDAPTVGPDAECSAPNRGRVTLTGLNPFLDRIEIDLEQLVASVDVDKNSDGTPPGCMSDPLETSDCAPLFGSLGISQQTGECVDNCSGQRLFDFTPSAQ